jgi:hypothetical protein
MMSFHVVGHCPGHVPDVERLERAWAHFVNELDELAGEPFEGYIAGGDWVGNDRENASAFSISARDVRAERRSREDT